MCNKIFLFGLLLYWSQAHSLQGLNLTDKPLFINQSVPPALAITFDDSGSMTSAFMPDTRLRCNCRSFTSPDYNFIYYNPEFEYPPPLFADGSSFPNSDFYNAKLDGFSLDKDIYPRTNLDTNYKVIEQYYPSYANGSSNVSVLEDEDFQSNRAFYYAWIGSETVNMATTAFNVVDYELREIVSNDEKQNFANWYSYYNTRQKAAKSAMSHAFANFNSSIKIDWQQINNRRFSQKNTNMRLFEGLHRDNFYNWLYLIVGNGATPLRRSIMEAGEYFQRNGADSPYLDSKNNKELSCQQNFHITISDGSWNGGDALAENYDADSSTILPSLPDGNTSSSLLFYRPNDSSSAIYSDSYTATLADNAFYYWSRDLRPDLVNNVPVYIQDYTDSNGSIVNLTNSQEWWGNNELFWNPKNNPASWQHLVNFYIGLGIEGTLDKIEDYSSLRNGSKDWPDPYISGGGKVDDVWHASINSRGDFFEARNSKELSESLSAIINNIVKRIGRASSGSVSSSIISNGSLSFKTGFDSSNWSGFLYSSQINEDGSIGEIMWDAGCKLTGGYCRSMNSMVDASVSDLSRTIIVYDEETRSQSSFQLANLSSSQISALLNSNYYQQLLETSDDVPFTVEDMVNYIRGKRTNELQNGGIFRNRESLLGDIVHSSAKVIRGPSASYRDEFWPSNSAEKTAAENDKGYNQYRENNQNRNSIILAGANDGMLHAFNAGIGNEKGGEEIWAYIPSQALDGMSELANPNYSHRSFVDATPLVKDAFLNNRWTTATLGGMRFGGQLFYALDLGADLMQTPKILWEFSNQDDIDMGYSYAGGLITRVAVPNGSAGLQSKWVAIIPNGYNSKNHQSAMYAIDMETGELLHKWMTNIGNESQPNGMGPPVAADFIAYDSLDNSTTYYGADQGTDFIYAGDLAGNVYRFDSKDIFSGNTTPEILYAGSFQQPITTAPRLFTPEDGSENIVVVFGTGKYIELDDRNIVANTPQYLFGLKDSKADINSAYTIDDSRLVSQTVETVETDENLRKLSSKTVSSANGWKLMLPEAGERLVNALVRNNQSKTLVATTLIPNAGDPCLAGGKSWVMVLDALSGGVPSIGSVFNQSSDGILINDMVLGVNTLTTPGGNQQFLSIDTASDEGSSQMTVELNTSTSWRRRSWHRIIFN